MAGDAWMREFLWSRYDAVYRAGDHVLDLGCGTGLDAVHLAQRGVRVSAVDASPRMLALTEARAAARGVERLVTLHRLDFGDLSSLGGNGFDGAIAAFGALNTVPDLQALAWELSQLLRPRARVVIHALNRTSLWELADLFRHAHWHRLVGLRRREVREFPIGGIPATHYMWHAGDFERDLSSHFSVRERRGLGIFRPPHTVRRVPAGVVAALARLDELVGSRRPFTSWGRFILLELEAAG